MQISIGQRVKFDKKVYIFDGLSRDGSIAYLVGDGPVRKAVYVGHVQPYKE